MTQEITDESRVFRVLGINRYFNKRSSREPFLYFIINFNPRCSFLVNALKICTFSWTDSSILVMTAFDSKKSTLNELRDCPLVFPVLTETSFFRVRPLMSLQLWATCTSWLDTRAATEQEEVHRWLCGLHVREVTTVWETQCCSPDVGADAGGSWLHQCKGLEEIYSTNCIRMSIHLLHSLESERTGKRPRMIQVYFLQDKEEENTKLMTAQTACIKMERK